MPAAVFGWTVSFAALVAGVFFLKIGPEVSRVWLATWFVSGAAALLTQRLIAGWYVRSAARSGRLYQRAVIYGAGPVTEDLISELEADTDSIVRIAGVFDDRETGARRARSADIRVSAASTTSSRRAAANASTSSSYRCRSRPRAASPTSCGAFRCCRPTSKCRHAPRALGFRRGPIRTSAPSR